MWVKLLKEHSALLNPKPESCRTWNNTISEIRAAQKDKKLPLASRGRCAISSALQAVLNTSRTALASEHLSTLRPSRTGALSRLGASKRSCRATTDSSTTPPHCCSDGAVPGEGRCRRPRARPSWTWPPERGRARSPRDGRRAAAGRSARGGPLPAPTWRVRRTRGPAGGGRSATAGGGARTADRSAVARRSGTAVGDAAIAEATRVAGGSEGRGSGHPCRRNPWRRPRQRRPWGGGDRRGRGRGGNGNGDRWWWHSR